MGNIFNSIRVRPPKRNRFNLSHNVKLTTSFGRLTPILVEDCLPGDVFKCNTEMLCRFMPLKAPIMQEINVYTHFFFVPKRLLWDKWKEFITGGEDGTSAPVYPRIDVGGKSTHFGSGSLADYLGFPVLREGEGFNLAWQNDDLACIDALPFRAYQLIYNEFYRDQNLTDEVDIKRDTSGIYYDSRHLQLRKRSWQKDYFTSALPWAQRGDEITLPLQAEAPFKIAGEGNLDLNLGQFEQLVAGNGGVVQSGNVAATPRGGSVGDLRDSKGTKLYVSNCSLPNSRLQISAEDVIHDLFSGVDLSKATAATINELRRAIKAQEFLEVGARGGSRYIEQIYSYFGVRSSDARLQRPQFLGGGKSPVVISDVLQTSQTTESSPQATPSGHAISVQNSHSFKFSCEEHGYIIGIMSIMPKASYMQGLPRKYSKFHRLDHYWPQFAHLGEQEIKSKELYVNFSLSPSSSNVSYDDTFGYTPRYAEYKFHNDSVHGNFRDNLAFWHMGRIFEKPPLLNNDFLTSMVGSTDRAFAVTDVDADPIWVQIYHNFKALRKMPKFGTPLF